jgi:hypothetical protein
MPPSNPFSTFADPNSFLGRPLIPRIGSALESAGRSLINALTPATGTPPPTMAGVSIPPAGASTSQLNPFPALASLNPFGSRPLVRTDYGEITAPSVPNIPQLPSGAMMTGSADIYPTTPRFPSTPVPLPTSPSMTSVGSNMVTTPRPTASFGTPQQIPFTPTPTVQPRINTAVREGTISATPQQLANLNARTTAYEGRTPEQQQALLAQMRNAGQNIASNYTRTMQNFAQNRIPQGMRVTDLPAPQGSIGQSLAANFPQSMESRQAASNLTSQRLAATGFGSMSNQQQSASGLPFSRPSVFSGLGAFNTAPQPSQSIAGGFGSGSITRPSQYSNARAEQRQMINNIARSYGAQPAYSRQAQNQYAEEFRRAGII